MSRRERVEEYEEREYYTQQPERQRPIRGRDLEEVWASRTEVRERERERDRQPEFLRNDFGRTNDQPLVLRKREVETFERPIRRRSRDRSESVDRERVRERVVERERERDLSPSPPDYERTRTKVVERERERDRSVDDRYRTRYVEREREVSPARSEERVRTRIVEHDRERDRSPSRVRTTTRVVERERERERSPSPLPERERIRTRVVERERERTRSSSSDSSVSGVRINPPVIRAPPIHQEIITHHRHIDHGYDYAAVPDPPPPRPRSRARETEIDIYTGRGETEVDIYKSRGQPSRDRLDTPRNGRDYYDDEYAYERDDRDRERDRLRIRTSDQRSVSARPYRDSIGPIESEADYYARKVDERAYLGEAYNGATKDWAIVDVPPGTERVKMDGIGGGSQEITWQRYNGVRRSKFIPERESQVSISRDYEREEVSDRRVGRPLPPPLRNPLDDMWTEITKDLVVKEAIEELGYDYEETEFFYYVFRYLRYEDVQELVDLSSRIRKERRSRIREIAHERERIEERKEILALPAPPARRRDDFEEERVIEREIIYPRGYAR